MNQYLYYSIWTPAIVSTHTNSTVKLFPPNLHIPTSTRDQIIIAAASHLTKYLLMPHSNILLPPQGTDTREHLIDLEITFHQLLPKNNSILLPAPPTINIMLPLQLLSNTNTNVQKYSIVSPTDPLSRMQVTKSYYSTAQVTPSITK